MKFYTFLFALLLFTATSMGQVAINTDGSTPHNSAMLDIKSATKGLLVPRSSNGSISILTTAPNGMIMYDTSFQRFKLRVENNWRDLVDSRS